MIKQIAEAAVIAALVITGVWMLAAEPFQNPRPDIVASAEEGEGLSPWTGCGWEYRIEGYTMIWNLKCGAAIVEQRAIPIPPPPPEPVVLEPVIPWTVRPPVYTSGITVTATYYHPSLHGGIMYCGGVYNQWDETVVAVAVANNWRWPCGTTFRISGPGGAIIGTRVDGCGGCGINHVDLSTAGFSIVCGSLSRGTCYPTLEVLR